MKAYFQCPKCKRPFSTKHSGSAKSPPQIECHCGYSDGTQPGTPMTFRGYGWNGRNNWPHGQPPREDGPALPTECEQAQ